MIKSRLPDVGTTIFTVMSQAALEYQAVNVGQGVPDFNPPKRLLERVTEHLYQGNNQYAPMAGVAALREAIAIKVMRCYQRRVCAYDDITVTCGGTEAIASSIQALVHPGDEVILLDPAYDSYQPVVSLCGGTARRIPLLRPSFSIDWQRLRDTVSDRTRLIVINTPHNPSGTCLTQADLDQLADIIRETKITLLCDEVYEHMVFDGAAHVSVHGHAELSERSIVVSSFGKTYHATGWKIGYCVAPKALTAELRKVHQFITFAIATPLQYAIADFMMEHPEWEMELPLFYQAKRDYFNALLASSRLTLVPTAATYFQLVDYSQISEERDTDIALRLVKNHGVATIPISPFSEQSPRDERLLRLCFAKSDEALISAAERLSAL
jgi:methionine aminotransferase